MLAGKLFICPTPLGNLEDITLRVLRVLREVDKIAAEDTRHTRKLLTHYDIHTPLVSFHEHNKVKKTAAIIAWLQNGQTIALVSDAGTPAIADPGEELVRAAVANEIPVIALPGPVAAVTALSASGYKTSPFVFYGFLPPRGTQKKEVLAKILAEDKTVIFYEAPHRLLKTLIALQEDNPQRQAVVGRELTKLHEQYHRGPLEHLVHYFTETDPRGECTVLLAPQAKQETVQENPLELAKQYLAHGLSTRQAALAVSQQTGIPKNIVYRTIIEKE